MEIVFYPHPALRQRAGDITCIDDALRSAVREMFELMYSANGVGLAANQVGLPLRFFVMNPSGDRDEPEHEQVVINPIVRNKRGAETDEEGCLSLPSMHGDVRRATDLTVEYFTLEGETVKATLSDFTARVFQHEFDHLEGVLFIDHLPAGEQERFLPRLTELSEQFEATKLRRLSCDRRAGAGRPRDRRRRSGSAELRGWVLTRAGRQSGAFGGWHATGPSSTPAT
ncbi:MAG: peptide deformylase [Planctomycetaceae bacterium]